MVLQLRRPLQQLLCKHQVHSKLLETHNHQQEQEHHMMWLDMRYK